MLDVPPKSNMNKQQKEFIRIYCTYPYHFYVDAAAGTGKTECMSHIGHDDKGVAFVTPTHQSKNVLLARMQDKDRVFLIHTLVFTRMEVDTYVHTFIIEESSMIDCRMLYKLIKRYPNKRYIMVGDRNQLPL